MISLSCARALLQDPTHKAYLHHDGLHIVVWSHPEQEEREVPGYYLFAHEEDTAVFWLKGIHLTYDVLMQFLADADIPGDTGWQPVNSASEPHLFDQLASASLFLQRQGERNLDEQP